MAGRPDLSVLLTKLICPPPRSLLLRFRQTIRLSNKAFGQGEHPWALGMAVKITVLSNRVGGQMELASLSRGKMTALQHRAATLVEVVG